MFKSWKKSLSKVWSRIAAFFLIVGIVVSGFVSGALVAHADNPGAIWTTDSACGTLQQDENHFVTGEHIFINGSGFDADTYSWKIEGQPGGASGDPHIIVASNSIVIGANGTFCFDAYIVHADDWGEYTVDINDGKGHGKNDNYQANVTLSSPSPTPTATPTATPCNGEFCSQSTPTATPTATPTIDPCNVDHPCATATPQETSNPDVCANIDGIQTSVPDGLHLDASGRNCVAFEYSGAPTPPPAGQVLGASTMAATGTAKENLSMALIEIGALVAVSSLYGFAKTTYRRN